MSAPPHNSCVAQSCENLTYADSMEKLLKALKPVAEEQDADAAVALLLKPKNQTLELFFVKRADNPADPWSGQMAFPGGKRDPKDQNLKQTVVRETLEETSINLLDRSRFLGAMEPLRSTRRPEMRILPFIILLEHDLTIKLNEELEWFVWVSPEELLQHRGTARLSFGEVSAYVFGEMVIWGLTYRILRKFFQILGWTESGT